MAIDHPAVRSPRHARTPVRVASTRHLQHDRLAAGARRTRASARSASSSRYAAPTVTRIVPAASSSPSRVSRAPSGATCTWRTSIPRSAAGGSEVIVARRPPSLTAMIASAALAGAAFTARSAPRPAVGQPPHLAGPVRRPAVDDVRPPGGAEPSRGDRSRGGYQLGPPARGQLHEQHAGDAAGPVDQQQGRAWFGAKPVAQRLVRGETRHGQGCRHVKRHRVGDGRDVGGCGHEPFGPCPLAAQRSECVITRSPTATPPRATPPVEPPPVVPPSSAPPVRAITPPPRRRAPSAAAARGPSHAARAMSSQLPRPQQRTSTSTSSGFRSPGSGRSRGST